ncbi:MAG: Lar family restriction alleviation protein [Thermoplasmata archaeon]
MSGKPLPCPFCGEEDCFSLEYLEGEPIFYLMCLDCGTTGPSASSEEEAYKLWDKRVKKP